MVVVGQDSLRPILPFYRLYESKIRLSLLDSEDQGTVETSE